MTTMTTAKARQKFSDLINRAAYGKERIVLTRRGKKLAVIVPIEDLEILEEVEEMEYLHDVKAVEEAWKEQGDKPLRDWEDVKKDLGL